MLMSLLSCNTSKKCDYKEFGNFIIIQNWKNTDFHVSKAELEINASQRPMTLNIVNHHSKENPLSEEVLIAFDSNLNSKEDYTLILNDSIRYHINNFELVEETKMTGISKINFCSIKSFQVNGKRISDYPSYNQIVFNKSLD